MRSPGSSATRHGLRCQTPNSYFTRPGKILGVWCSAIETIIPRTVGDKGLRHLLGIVSPVMLRFAQQMRLSLLFSKLQDIHRRGQLTSPVPLMQSNLCMAAQE
jgi:hypothetical protein